MRITFLRGAIPPKHEHPEKLLYDTIEECEDMWTQLFWYLLQELGAQGELLYQGGSREFVIDGSLTERWIPSIAKHEPSHEPDIIIARGGFPYYDDFMRRFPRARKAYYGAGKRYYPTTGFTDYELFLTDAPSQLDKIRARGKRAELFIKPAATMFCPAPDEAKQYDVCFVANAAQELIKRHAMLIKALAGSGLRCLNIGNTSLGLVRKARAMGSDISWAGWHLRKHLPRLISQCRVGVCCSTGYDSCPRVIPEYLACGLPVVVTRSVNFWRDRYVTPMTGVVVDDDQLLGGIREALKRFQGRDAREHYTQNLSMTEASKWLKSLLSEG